jgi:hypothetical protein
VARSPSPLKISFLKHEEQEDLVTKLKLDGITTLAEQITKIFKNYNLYERRFRNIDLDKDRIDYRTLKNAIL